MDNHNYDHLIKITAKIDNLNWILHVHFVCDNFTLFKRLSTYLTQNDTTLDNNHWISKHRKTVALAHRCTMDRIEDHRNRHYIIKQKEKKDKDKEMEKLICENEFTEFYFHPYSNNFMWDMYKFVCTQLTDKDLRTPTTNSLLRYRLSIRGF